MYPVWFAIWNVEGWKESSWSEILAKQNPLPSHPFPDQRRPHALDQQAERR